MMSVRFLVLAVPAQNAHLLSSKLRFFALSRLVLPSLATFFNTLLVQKSAFGVTAISRKGGSMPDQRWSKMSTRDVTATEDLPQANTADLVNKDRSEERR